MVSLSATEPDPEVVAKAQAILERLRQRTPTEGSHGRLAPIDQLVCTILSQNTTDASRDRAYADLRSAYPDWPGVLAAPTARIESLIRVCGLANQKAPRIQRALRAVSRAAPSGASWSLDFLREMSPADARAWLTAIDGVGIKTASIVMLFALDMPAVPVDTHVHRVAGRLGLISATTTAERAHHVLEAIVPPSDYLPFHLALIHHGRAVCRSRRPRCESCPLEDLCVWRATAAAGR